MKFGIKLYKGLVFLKWFGMGEASYDFNKEEDVKLFLENLGTEYRFGCYSEKKPDVCHLLGDYMEIIKRDYVKASKVYQSNCDDLKFGKSCFKYGNFKYLGKGCSKDLTESLEYYIKGCSSEYPGACINGGSMLLPNSNLEKEIKPDFKQAMAMLEKGCCLSESLGCQILGTLYITGIPGHLSKDMDRAFEYSVKSCQLGNVQACVNVSQMYLRGEGVEKDEKKGEEYKRRAIDMANPEKEKAVEFQQGSSIS